MGKTIRVTPEELGMAAEKLKNYSTTYTEIYQKLMSEATNMGSAWEGEDNQAFVQQITGFCTDLKSMAARLEAAGEALDAMKTRYASQQMENISAVQKLQN